MIKIQFIIFLNLVITLTLQSCSTLKDSVQIFPSQEEIYNWNLIGEFFKGSDLKFSLNDTAQTAFKIINPVENTGGEAKYLQIAQKIVSAKAKTSNEVWVNQFAFLYTDNISFYLSEAQNDEFQNYEAPQFNEILKVDDIYNELDCFDFEYISEDTYLVDCQNIVNKKVQNILYYLTSTNTTQVLVEEALIPAYKGRMLGKYTVQGQGKNEFTYLVKTTPSFSISIDGTLVGDSLIEVYLLDQFGFPRNTGYVLDSITMSQLLQNQSKDFQFNIVDVNILDNGDIYLLDAFQGIYVVNFIPNGQFMLKNQIQTSVEQAFAFNRQRYGQNNQKIVILGFKFIEIILEGKFNSIYSLPDDIQYNYPAHISLSQQQFVYKIYNLTYLFNIDYQSEKLLLIQTLPENNYPLLNPLFPDLIILTLDNAYRYTLSNGYLQYQGCKETQEQKYLEIIATNEQNTCTTIVLYQIINGYDDQQLYQIDNNVNFLPQLLTTTKIQCQIDQLCSGPNQQYRMANPQPNPVSASMFNFLKLELQFPEKLAFQYVQVGNKPNYFYLVQQQDNGGFVIMNCTHQSIYSPETTQSKLFEPIRIGTIFTKTSFQIWESERKQLEFAYVVDNIIFFKKLEGNEIVDVTTVELSDDIFILQLDEYLYALSNQTIHAISKDGEIVSQTNVATLKQQGYTGEWNPIKIYGNKRFKQTLIFVLHHDHICILDFHTQFNFINQIAHQSDYDTELAIGPQTFFIVTDSLKEYNYEILSNIYFLKYIKFGKYSIQQPISMDFCSETGYLFLAIYEISWDDYYLFVTIAPNRPKHESLIRSIGMDYYQIDQISASGTDQSMYIYVKVHKKLYFYCFLTKPALIIEKNINNPVLSAIFSLQLLAYNPYSSITISNDIRIIDPQIKLFIDEEKFKKYSQIEIQLTMSVTKMDLGNDWYFGQIAQFSIWCAQCDKNQGITITQLVESDSTPIISNYDIRFYLEENLYQATNALIQVDNKDNIVKIIEYTFKKANYQCFQGTTNVYFVFSLCNDGVYFTIYAVDKLNWSTLGEKFRLGKIIQKIQLIEHNILIILTDKQLSAYNVNTNDGQWELFEIFVIDLEFIQESYENIKEFTPNDFIIQSVNYIDHNRYYKIIVSSQQGLFIEDFYYEGSLFIFTPLYLEYVDLTSELIKNKQYILNSTSYLQIKSLDQFKDNQLQILIQTSNVNHFGLSLVFTTKQGQNYLIYETLKVQFNLNQYETWQTINHLAVENNYAAIPYQSGVKVIVGVYPIIQSQTTTIIGSHYFNCTHQVTPFEFSLFFRSGKLYSSKQQSLFRYNIITEPVLKFNITSQLQLISQNIQIQIKNDFDFIQTNFQLSVVKPPNPPTPDPPPNPDPDPTDDVTHYGIMDIIWWIILCLSAILTLIAIGYLIYRLKRQDDNDLIE